MPLKFDKPFSLHSLVRFGEFKDYTIKEMIDYGQRGRDRIMWFTRNVAGFVLDQEAQEYFTGVENGKVYQELANTSKLSR